MRDKDGRDVRLLLDAADLLARLQTLESLDLSDNNISDASPLYTLKGLKKLKIERNSLTAEQLSDLKAALPNCSITCEIPEDTAPMQSTPAE